MKPALVRVEREESVAIVTLNRPEVRNALNTPLLLEMRKTFEEIGQDEGVAVVILTGAGNSFCAGMDLKAIGAARGPGEPDPLLVAVEAFEALEKLPQPVIAAINGPAITGGLELALACDILIAAQGAVLGDTHARVGVIPGGGNTQCLPRILGPSRAKELLFASDYMPAEEALRWGLVSRVVPPEALMDVARALARQIAANHPPTVRLMKSLINRGLRLDFGSGLALERAEFLRLLLGRQPAAVEARRQLVVDTGRKRVRELKTKHGEER
jgi:enoyl-CoA hydratase